MKNKLMLLCVVIVIIAIQACNKDDQPRYINIEILPRTGQKIVQMEKYIDDNRATSDPSGYHALAINAKNQVMEMLLYELRPDTFDRNSGDINTVVGAYDRFWREKSPKKKSKVWTRLDVGTQRDVYRVCPTYSKKLLQKLKDYCSKYVNGGSEYVSGERIDSIEIEIQYLFLNDPDVVWQYGDQLYNYFLKFAENPNNKAKYKKDGFLNFGWWN